MIIRDMKKQDLDTCIHMMEDFYQSPAVSHRVPRAIHERSFQAAIDREPLLRGLVLEHEGKIVGYAMVVFSYACEVGGRQAMLDELYLVEDCRGMGLGNQFFKWFFDEYGDMVRLRLEVTAENPGAIRLYQRLGFQRLDYIQMVRDHAVNGPHG